MSLTELLAKQQVQAELLIKFPTNYRKTPTAKRTKGLITERLAEVKRLWQEFSQTHYAILTLAVSLSKEDRAKYKYLTGETYSEIEEKYFEFISGLRDSLNALEPSTEQPSNISLGVNTSVQGASLKLPRISIPTFSGSYDSWRSFHDLFQALVHSNSELSPVQKLHYLKSSVSGEAEHLLRQFSVTNASYENAWKVLLKRYDNKRVLVNTQLKLLFNLPKITSESAREIKMLLDTSSEIFYELAALGVPTKDWDTILIYLLVQRLPPDTHRMWEEEQKGSENLLTLENFKKFLETRFRTLEAISESRLHAPEKSTYSSKASKVSTHFAAAFQSCIVCKESHHLYQCPKFRQFEVNKRQQLVSSNQLCNNCLSENHKLQFCASKNTCRRCGKRHHTLLHRMNQSQSSSPQKNPPNNDSTQPQESGSEINSAQTFYANRRQQAPQSLLSTALINIPSASGRTHTLRALLDSGSQVSFVTQAAIKRLKLSTTPANFQITGLGSKETTQIQAQTVLKLNSSIVQQNPTVVTAFVVPKITDLLPPETIASQGWSHIKNLPLADPYFNQPGKIDLLLGADVYGDIILEGLCKGPPGTPIAQNSIFGWILFGPVSQKSQPISRASTFMVNSLPLENKDGELESMLRRFWESEEVQIKNGHSTEEQECELLFEKTHRRNENGRYEVRLPFKKYPPILGNSRHMAIRRFFGLEKRLASMPELYAEYRQCLNEYLSMGHMRSVPTDAPNIPSYYLPHHAVVKDSTTTKVRVVFDASAKTSNGKSLNEQLHPGPLLQSELLTILLRWRMFQYAMSADIEKMYRMINIQDPDQHFQRIIWRNSPDEPIKEYMLTTVTFGTTSAPYLAIKSLHQLASDEQTRYPLAAKVVTRDFYVDDLLTGADSVDEALEIQNQLLNLMSAGGFNLRKWVSNSPEILATLPDSLKEIQLPLKLATDKSIKTLGIHWYPTCDYFTLQYKQFTERPSTKRTVLSDIAMLFDPLGWISPIVVTAKILMQELWLSGCFWDDPIPESLLSRWQQFKSQLHHISDIHIPRWLHTKQGNHSMQIHGFSDASIHAYSATAYMRVIDDQGQVHTNLIIAKSKVAPVKAITLPRLELCGALLLARLLKRVQEDLGLSSTLIFAWTDSTIVLCWIQNQSSKYKTFVANRISQIQELSENIRWQHVSSADNPADCNSRGMKPLLLMENTLWWKGPNWLQLPETYWPQETSSAQIDDPNEEKRVVLTSYVNPNISAIIARFSSLPRLLRTLAYCFRFVQNCRKSRKDRLLTHLSSTEIEKTRLLIIKAVQSDHFYPEIQSLKSNSAISSKSSIISLTPILDTAGVLRVGGRLQNANIPESQKHPMILPRKSHFTHLLINYLHLKTMHGGTQLVLATLRNEFWVVRGRETVRHIIRKCITCWKQTAQTQNQIMGNLPEPRVNISRTFQHTGIDFAGPINLTMSRHRGNRAYKGYICIFICLSTKAIHIEPTSDLSTASFLAALRRFISRRGLCTDIYTDCGTNFVGANKILQDEFSLALKEATETAAERLAHEGISWHFNPPAAPHFGGLWEAGVKAIKHHLKRVLHDSLLTFEEFSTVLSQIEACLNSRPLCPLSEDPEDFSVLTPGHFLIGSALTTLPAVPTKQISSMARWNHLQQLQGHFWDQWSKIYLNTLQNKTKWTKPTENIKVGELVLVKENKLPPCKWIIGRIISTHQGADNLVRVVTVKTHSGTFKRPITKVAVLPKNA